MTYKSLEDMSVPELVAHARQTGEKAGLLDTLLGDPSTRADALKLLKKRNPSMPIPEIDAETAAEKLIAEERKERLVTDQRVRDMEIRERIANERKRVMKQHDLSEEDMAEVEKLMVDPEAPINHYDAAAKVFKASKVLATPTSHAIAPPTFDMPDKDIWKSGVGSKANLDKIAMTEAYKALNEFRGGKAA